MDNKRDDSYRGYDFGYGASGNSKPNKPRSKYLRNPGEKKTSKYVRDKNEAKPRSKYARDKYEVREHHYNLARNYREEEKIVEELTEELAAQAAESETEANETPQETEALEKETVESLAEETEISADESTETSEITETPDNEDGLKSVEEYEKQINGENKSKYSDEVANMFSHSKLSRETTVAQVQNEDEIRRKLIIKTIIVLVVLTVAACVLQYATIKISYMPSFMNIEFSAFPELIASLAYGPVFGIIIIIIKNLFHMFVSNAAYGSIVSNVVLDSIFVLITGLFYSKRMFAFNPKKTSKPQNKDKRKGRIFTGGLIASAVTTFLSFFLTRFVSYPLLVIQHASNGITNGFLMEQYQIALKTLNRSHPELVSGTLTEFVSMTQAILFYNMPLTLVKYLFAAIAAAITYPVISPYIHFRKNTK